MRNRVLLADADAIWRRGLRLVLEPRFQVVAEASASEEAVEKAIVSKPDVVVLDVDMDQIDGVPAARHIKERLPETGVVMVASVDRDRDVHEAIESGATDYLLKNGSPSTLIQAVEQAAESGAQPSSALAKRLNGNGRTDEHPAEPVSWKPLSGRENQVLGLLAEGKRAKEVARNLGISERTVDRHLLNLYCKLGVSSRIAAVSMAVKKGILRI
jgi:DNA-binding NarL/FixJ family response regulator